MSNGLKIPAYVGVDNRRHGRSRICGFCRLRLDVTTISCFCIKCPFVCCKGCAVNLDWVDTSVHSLVAFENIKRISIPRPKEYERVTVTRSRYYYGTSRFLCGTVV
jgi:hypothetical protein